MKRIDDLSVECPIADSTLLAIFKTDAELC